ncbi:hypothetical protein J6590_100486, partial [Homalodisca vitripennis]
EKKEKNLDLNHNVPESANNVKQNIKMVDKRGRFVCTVMMPGKWYISCKGGERVPTRCGQS